MPPKKAQQAPTEPTLSTALFDQIAYCSLASPGVSALQLVSQLQASPADITGLLIFEGRLLIHWLEGPPEQIQSLWAQVQSDEQQYCVARLMYRQPKSERLFAEWQMRAANRQEMMLIVREIKELVIKDQQTDAQALEWQHTISMLSILLDPELTRFYAPPAQAGNSEQSKLLASPAQEKAAC